MTMMRKMLGSKIHRATVTESNRDYEGSITIPPNLMQAAHLLPHEAVQVWNVTSGSRFETYAIVGIDESSICINGAAAHLAHPGDLVIIARFIWLSEEACQNFQPQIVMVDADNKITKIKNKENIGAS